MRGKDDIFLDTGPKRVIQIAKRMLDRKQQDHVIKFTKTAFCTTQAPQTQADCYPFYKQMG